MHEWPVKEVSDEKAAFLALLPLIMALDCCADKFAIVVERTLAAHARQLPGLQREPQRLERLEAFSKTNFRDDLLNVVLVGRYYAGYLTAFTDS